MRLSEKLIFDKLYEKYPDSPVLNEIYYAFSTVAGYHSMFKNVNLFIKHLMDPTEKHEVQFSKTNIANSSSFTDFRFKYLKLKYFRGILSGPDDGYLGIDFRGPNPNQMPSMIMLGHNGCGKTSLYNAMEYLFTEDIALARKHNFDLSKAVDRERFLPNAFSNGNLSIQLDTFDGLYEYPSATKSWTLFDHGIGVNSFFCSESDLVLFEVDKRTISDYIKEQIGIYRFVDLLSILTLSMDELELYLKEVYGADLNDPSERNSLNIDDVFKLDNKDDLDELYKDLKQLTSLLREEVELQSADALVEIKDILDRLLKDVNFWNKNLQEELASLDSNNPIIINKHNGLSIDPRTYFNNFRFKMFMISLNIAIAFNYMRKHSICFPLVFDDIFNASDFSSRSIGVKNYIKNVLNVYNEKFSSWPELSIVLFTQDEVVADAVYKGFVEANINNDTSNKVRLCKMFNRRDLVKEPDMVAKNGEIIFYKIYDVIRKNY